MRIQYNAMKENATFFKTVFREVLTGFSRFMSSEKATKTKIQDWFDDSKTDAPRPENVKNWIKLFSQPVESENC